MSQDSGAIRVDLDLLLVPDFRLAVQEQAPRSGT